ncbi:hypothetical protein L1987_53161 [Smallanthus sonchifolius]|uniref:Uncharacterized protein n=1 Tax=Smallanthus sonchifolius TaxID=185202 RepID=A0ACB9EV90_9ASTR|nr:hypothetical protein L1987_53161 [Smallanthus sonchifolius]
MQACARNGLKYNKSHRRLRRCCDRIGGNLSKDLESDSKKLEELGSVLTSLDPWDSIVITKAFSHMLNLANLAGEVHIAHRRRIKLKTGDFADEANSTTESDIEENLKKLMRSEGPNQPRKMK